MAASRRQRIILDRAIASETELTTHLSTLLDADITQVTVVLTDLVLDKTIVDVTYRVRRDTSTHGKQPPSEAGSTRPVPSRSEVGEAHTSMAGAL